ncbi:ABC transporter permease [Desulfurispora thermophila]|uniref:ABC transporter permease n=1 Tax=Desulfurispora thermophila TaxID=265470 RepID=UPI001FA80735|nr:iron ABC transporter permease [Desulfurispora thermophila]
MKRWAGSKLKMWDGWAVLSLLFLVLLLLPAGRIFGQLLKPAGENWAHIRQYLFRDYLLNTLQLVGFTGLGTALLGTGLAWLVSACDFPLRVFFRRALFLPLALPPYIAACTYSGLLGYTGPLRSLLRQQLAWEPPAAYFDIMNLPGAVFIFTLVLYPYVYAVTRAFWEKQSASLLESARLLGRGQLAVFRGVALPLSRPAVVGGVSLVAMEVLGDYGVVHYFGLPTFSTAIFKTWFGMGDVDAAVRLAAVLMLVVLLLLLLESLLRGGKKYSPAGARSRPLSPWPLQGGRGWLAFGCCAAVFSLGFLIPVGQLVYWAWHSWPRVLGADFARLLAGTLLVAWSSALLVLVVALIMANYSRLHRGVLASACARATVLGYSIPGPVIAIGVLAWFIALDTFLHPLYRSIDPQAERLWLTGSLVMLIYALVVRFLAMGFNPLQAGFAKLGNRFSEASRTLGAGVTATFWRVDLPLLRPAVAASFLLVFVEVIKELPLTLMLRPFNFNTLAGKVFQYAGDEMLPEAAVPALVIVALSTLAVWWLESGDRRW